MELKNAPIGRASYDPVSNHGNVRRIAIATTNRCQARCAHCLMNSGPTGTEELTASEMIGIIDYYASNTPLKLVAFTGGESTLLGDSLLEAISYCSEQGIMSRLVTNASWAEDQISAESTVFELRNAGLTEINYSTDDFHSVWIPLANVKRAWNASKGQGFETVLIAVCSGPRSKITPMSVSEFLGEQIPIVESLDRGDDNLPEPAEDGTRYLISQSAISRLGRGRRLRSEYFGSHEEFNLSKLYGGCPALMDPPTVNADGTVGVCCGTNTEHNSILTIGDIQELMSNGSYDVDEFQGLILHAIRTLGPTYLYHLATESATSVRRTKAMSVCEICERLTGDRALIDVLYDKRELIEQQIEQHYRVCKLFGWTRGRCR